LSYFILSSELTWIIYSSYLFLFELELNINLGKGLPALFITFPPVELFPLAPVGEI
jgi:hypothetical protein